MGSSKIRDFPVTSGISKEIDTGWIGDGGSGCIGDGGSNGSPITTGISPDGGTQV